jgi:hypothetical protein
MRWRRTGGAMTDLTDDEIRKLRDVLQDDSPLTAKVFVTILQMVPPLLAEVQRARAARCGNCKYWTHDTDPEGWCHCLGDFTYYSFGCVYFEPREGELTDPLARPPPGEVADRPRVVCLCGSTRFFEAFQQANYSETMAGRIVLSVGFYPHRADMCHGQTLGCTAKQKLALDELHKRKIDLADEILVLNVNGYVGDSTRSEIEYAQARGKPVRYLEPREGDDG